MFVSRVALLLPFLCTAASLRARRAAYDLPSGALEATGLSQVKRVFKCESDGYFADVANECKLFHICATPVGADKKAQTQSTMACGQNQRFDQSKLVCVADADAIPCKASPDFFYLNERIGEQNAAFLGPTDVDKAKNARPDYRARK